MTTNIRFNRWTNTLGGVINPRSSNHRHEEPETTDWNSYEFTKADTLSEKSLNKLLQDGRDVWLDDKIDGHRRILVAGTPPRCLGRRHSEVTGHREDVFLKVGPNVRRLAERLPPGTAIDGELYVEGGTSTDVQRLMASDSDKLAFIAFGIVHSPWHDLAVERQWLKDHGIPVVASKPVRTSTMIGYESFVAGLEAEARARRVEGFILKTHSSGLWLKFKLEETFDVVVVGATDAGFGTTGKYMGQIGALVCAMRDGDRWHEVCLCSGMDDEDRIRFTEKPPVGEVIEVRAQGWGSRGRLRHPRFKQMRPDKPIAECVLPAWWHQKFSQAGTTGRSPARNP